MYKVLIISPHFPPVNAADMHRVRQGLPYFRQLGWEPVIITVDEECIESYSSDPLLLKSIPSNIEVHKVKAFSIKMTRKFGLGSLSMRSYFQIRKKGNELLRTGNFDLVYFSTTAFHVMALGPEWKKKFGVPFILDIQDPWRNDFYLDKPKSERPPKFLLAYNIDKYLEARTVSKADGIISVSGGYIDTFLSRYPSLSIDQCRIIPFGAAVRDFEVMQQYVKSPSVPLPKDKINLLYIGRGGHDMQFSLKVIFSALAMGKREAPDLFGKLHCTFIGTSYATKGTGKKTVEPIASLYQVSEQVTEITDRYPYFETLYLLKNANALIVPGSTDVTYTASKIYPYLLAEKPLLAVFYEKSSVVKFLKDMNVEGLVQFSDDTSFDQAVNCCFQYLLKVASGRIKSEVIDLKAFEPYSAFNRTREQVDFFEEVVRRSKRNISK